MADPDELLRVERLLVQYRELEITADGQIASFFGWFSAPYS